MEGTIKKKSGRTSEQQAAREARKAAKITATKTENEPESSAQAIKREAQAAKRKTQTPSSPDTAKEIKDKVNGHQDTQNTGGAEDELEIDLNAPMPMSKAEARAARKKAKQGVTVAPKPVTQETEKKRKRLSPLFDDEDDEQSKKGSGEISKPKKVKAQPKNSVWIGNLPYRFSKTDLREWFVTHLQEKGEDVSATGITRINLPKHKGNGTFADNKGYAYVDFATEDLQRKAVGLSETMLTGRRVLIKLGDDHNDLPDARTPRPIKVEADPRLPAQPHGESATLFMGNLPWDATEELLRELIESNADPNHAAHSTSILEPIAPPTADDPEAEPPTPAIKPDLDAGREGKASGLRKIRVGTFEDSGNCKGFAFLDFHTPRQATIALSKRGNRLFRGRQLVLQYASAEATKRGASKRMMGPPKDKSHDGPKKGVQSERVKRYAGKSSWKDQGAGKDEGEATAEPVIPRRAANDSDIAKSVLSGLDGEESGHHKVDRGSRSDGKRGKKWEASGRPRPGAALAMAKREKVGIVESQGNKIVF